MSTGISNDPRSPRVPVFQQVAFAFAGFIALGAMLYFGFGRELFEEFEREAQSSQDPEDESAGRVDTESDDESKSATPQSEQQSGASINSASEQLLRQRLDEADTELSELKEQLALLLAERNERLDADRQRAALPVDTDMALNRARIQEAHMIGVTIDSELAAYREQIMQCAQLKNSLNEVGRRLAADTELVAKYAVLPHSDLPTHYDSETFEAPFMAAFSAIKHAYEVEDYSSTVSPEDVDFLRKFLARTRSDRASLALYAQSLQYLIKASQTSDPGEQTLDEAVWKMKQERAAEFLNDLVTAERETEESVSAQLREKIAEDRRRQAEPLFNRTNEAWMQWLPNRRGLQTPVQTKTATFTRLAHTSTPVRHSSTVRRRCRCP